MEGGELSVFHIRLLPQPILHRIIDHNIAECGCICIVCSFNFQSEDEHTLSHIPYLGDDVYDESYYGELMAAYPNGIHGEVRGSGELMNDYILYQLNKNIRAQFPHASICLI